MITENIVASHPFASSCTVVCHTREDAISGLFQEKLALNMSPLEDFNFAGILSANLYYNLDGVHRFEIVELVPGCQQHSHTKAGAGNGFNVVLSSASIVAVSLIRIVVEMTFEMTSTTMPWKGSIVKPHACTTQCN